MNPVLTPEKARSVSALTKTRRNKERVTNIRIIKAAKNHKIVYRRRSNSETWYNTWDMTWSANHIKPASVAPLKTVSTHNKGASTIKGGP
jgi:hypothetical protein